MAILKANEGNREGRVGEDLVLVWAQVTAGATATAVSATRRAAEPNDHNSPKLT